MPSSKLQGWQGKGKASVKEHKELWVQLGSARGVVPKVIDSIAGDPVMIVVVMLPCMWD
jgi:hypothetical protein